MEGMGLCKGPRAVNSASAKLGEFGREDDKEKLEVMGRTRFRSLAATLNNMSLDRSDAQHPAKEIHTKMVSPTRRSWKMLKKT